MMPGQSVSSREIHLFLGVLATDYAAALSFRLVKRDVSCSGLRLILDPCLADRATAPPGEGPAVLYDLGEFCEVFRIMDVGVSKCGGSGKHRGLNVLEQVGYGIWEASLGGRQTIALAADVAARETYGRFVQ